MANLRFMLDTNIVIYTMKNHPPQVRERFSAFASQLCVSTITVAELYYGAKFSQHPDKNLRTLEEFLSRLQVLDYDSRAGEYFGEIKANLRKIGRLIGENDMHIAGHARSLGLILVTNNVGEFERIDGLKIENWAI